MKTEEEVEGERLAAAVRADMSPAGKLDLPPLLEERRIKYGLPDTVFSVDCVYDRIYVAQVADHEEKTYLEKGLIVMPDRTASRKLTEACRGVLVGAGLLALDELRSNGVDLGHIVRFVKLAPYRMEIDFINGKSLDLLVMRAGDVTGSEDVNRLRRAGKLRIQWDDETRKHFYTDQDGHHLRPKLAWIPEDM